MQLKSALNRFKPLGQKLGGKLPLCPWPSVLGTLDPRTLAAYPPLLKIDIISEEGDFKKLRFDQIHEAWFPAATPVTSEMWSEYLSVFWTHRVNAHRYLAHGTFVEPGDVCIDCGACEGFFGFQALAAGAAKVVCVEPSGQMARCLQRTFAEEIKNGRVVIQNVAAGALEGNATFSFECLQPFSGKVQTGAASESVPVSTITKLCAELNLPRVDFIKMDIEGAEIQAVEGAMTVLKKYHPKLAITTYHRSFDYAALRTLLMAAGYRHIKPVGLTGRDDGVCRPIMLHAVR
jgi:FkbM family methyltransferase